MIRIERRLEQPKWLLFAVPVGSIVVAFGVMTIVLLITSHPPLHTFSRLLSSGFGSTREKRPMRTASPARAGMKVLTSEPAP